MIIIRQPVGEVPLHRAWWLRPTTVLKYRYKNHRFLNWDSYSGLGAKFGNCVWSFPIPKPRESFFEWSRSWVVRRTPPRALPPSKYPRRADLYHPRRDGYKHLKSSPFELAQRDRHWDWELRVRHIFDVPSEDKERRKKRFET